jgi:hypothetical protein
VLDILRHRGLLDERIADQTVRPATPIRFSPAEHLPDSGAIAIWRQARGCAGTAAEAYLQSRGLVQTTPPTLRYLARVPPSLSAGGQCGAMVAAVQAPSGTVVACQITFLDEKGKKAPLRIQRRTIGVLGGGAVRLAAAGDELGIAEGVEDALGALQLTGIPVWACLGAGRMHRVEIQKTVRTLHIFADDDEAGRAAADRTALVHKNAGIRVVIRRPPEGLKDWAAFAESLSIERAAA